MRNAAVVSVLLAAGFFVGCARGSGVARRGYDFGRLDRVAVVDVSGDIRGAVARDQVANFFNQQLLAKGYLVVQRSKMRHLLEEQEFQAGELTRSEGAVKAGRILNVDAVVMATLSASGNDLSITAEMVDVEDGSLLWAGEGSGTSGRVLGTVAGAAVGAAAGAALGGDTAGKVIGGVGGAALGGAGGYALSASEEELARKVVERTCRSLPPS